MSASSPPGWKASTRGRPVSSALRGYDSCCPAKLLATLGPRLTSSRGIRTRHGWPGCPEGFCRARLRLGEREHRVVGGVGQFAKGAGGGRRSGQRTPPPLTLFTPDVDGKPGVAILLTYGPDRDWLKNLNAAGSAQMRRHGKTFGVANPQTVTKEEAAAHVNGAAHRVFGRLPFEQAGLLTKSD